MDFSNIDLQNYFVTSVELSRVLGRQPQTIKLWEKQGIIPQPIFRYRRKTIYLKEQADAIIKAVKGHEVPRMWRFYVLNYHITNALSNVNHKLFGDFKFPTLDLESELFEPKELRLLYLEFLDRKRQKKTKNKENFKLGELRGRYKMIDTFDGKEMEFYYTEELAYQLNMPLRQVRKCEIGGTIPEYFIDDANDKRIYTREEMECIVKYAVKFGLTECKPIRNASFSRALHRELPLIRKKYE